MRFLRRPERRLCLNLRGGTSSKNLVERNRDGGLALWGLSARLACGNVRDEKGYRKTGDSARHGPMLRDMYPASGKTITVETAVFGHSRAGGRRRGAEGWTIDR